MTEKESIEDPSNLIYDLLECFMMTWEELIDRTSTTATRYDIWNEEVPETKNYSTLINERRNFKPQVNNQTLTNGGRHFEPQFSDSTSTNGGRHFKPQDTDPNDPTKIVHITKGETLQTPTFRDRKPSRSPE